MVAHFTMRTYEVNHAFRFVEGIWSIQNPKKNIGKYLFYVIRAQHLPFHTFNQNMAFWNTLFLHQCQCHGEKIGFILDGCLFHYAHIWSKSGFSSC